MKGCAIVLLVGHLLSGWPAGSSQKESNQRGDRANAAQPLSLLSGLSDVRPSKALHLALCFLITHLPGLQNLHKSEEAPGENLRPLRVPWGWLIAREGDKKGGSLVCVLLNCLANSQRLTLSFRLPHGRRSSSSRAACSVLRAQE